jgi:hypothetical protein
MKRLIRILAIFFGLIILPSASAFAAQIEYPQTRYEAVPTVGSITPTFVEIKTVADPVSDHVPLTGNVRFRNSGMLLKSSNFPPGSGMTSCAMT